jgi:hypothetical protein
MPTGEGRRVAIGSDRQAREKGSEITYIMQPLSQQRRRSVILTCTTRDQLAIRTLGRPIYLDLVNIFVACR